jgi:hypothetical protein
MTLEPETQKAIADSIQEVLSNQLPILISESNKGLLEQIERQQRDYKKLSDSFNSISKTLSEQVEQKISSLQPSLELLEEIRKQKEEPTPKTRRTSKEAEGIKDKADIDIDALRASLMAEIKQQYETKVEEFQRQLEERDRETQQLREAERQSKMRLDALGIMRSLGTIRPNTEEDLLTLLEKRGLITEESDRLYVKTQDKFGDPAKAELKDVLPKMLDTEFAHFAVPRPGTGTSAISAPSTTTSQYDFRGMSSQDIYNQYRQDPEAQKALIEVLEQQYGNNK